MNNLTQLLRRAMLSALTVVAVATTASAQSPCVNGLAAGLYPCDNVDLYATMGVNQVGGGEMNDIWGWTDPLDGKEYVLLGRTNGTAFIDISNPTSPVYLGNLNTNTVSSLWRDIKVYGNHAYIVSEAGSHGMQVFDLTKLRNVNNPPVNFSADAVYTGFGNAHNIVINEEKARAYGVGTNTASGGLHIVDISNPLNPTILGTFSQDGYTHDAQVVTYIGPDAQYQGKEIAFACNENTITIVDVDDPTDATLISTEGYSGSAYTHQGWLTEDHKYFVVGDELDEQQSGVNTRTYFFNVEDLNNPFLAGTYTATTSAIDHNLYIKDGVAFQSNYRAGLRLLDVSNAPNAEEIGYFDLYPSSDAAQFNGTWSNYPYFASGIVAVSHIEEGLFLLKPNFFTVSTTADLVCYNETVTITLVNGAASPSSTYSVSGLPAGTNANVDNTANGAVITLSGFPQGPVTDLNVTVSDNTGQSGSVSFTVYDCDNEVLGCTDSSALNFNPAATLDNGTCTYPCSDVTVTILTDNYPGETTWTVTDGSGTTVMSGGPYSTTATTYTETACLEVGCYTLNVFDSFGDGICCAYGTGSYTVNVDGTDVVTGGEFGTSTTENFCVESAAISGCTNLDACNFNPDATADDGSCILPYSEVYIDDDGDGIGGSMAVADACDPLPENWVLVTGDCNDDDASVYPGAPGTGQGVDNNCDGQVTGDEANACPQDLNNDGAVTVADVLLILGEFGCESNCGADVDGDGAVSVSDVLNVLSVFGQPC
ncbi:MAG: choice-of-anchor B family protein [Flavobacteriales bacterium]